MQKLLTLIIGALLLYSLIKLKINESINEKIASNQSNVTDIELKKDDSIQPSGNLVEQTLSKVILNILKTEEGRNFIENILQPASKPLAGPHTSYKINNNDLINSLFKIQTFDEGNIGPASCGQIVTVNYRILAVDNNQLIEDKTQTFTLGSSSVMLGLDNVIIGMMIGQTRHAVIPAKYAYSSKNNINYPDNSAYFKISVTLKEILPKHFIKHDEIKIFDDEIAYNMPILCGTRVAFNAKIIKLLDGKIIYDSRNSNHKIDFVLGDMSYPAIFSHGLFGKIPVGTRTIITKGHSFQSFGMNVSKIFPAEQLPSDEYYMLELTDFDQAPIK